MYFVGLVFLARKSAIFQTLWINTRLIHVITEEIPLTKKIGTEHKIDTHKIQVFLETLKMHH